MAGEPVVLDDGEALARHAAAWLVERIDETDGPFRIALSGGSTPRRLYELLGVSPFIDRVDWRRVVLFWGDERFVPLDHPDSNYAMTKAALLDFVPIPPENIHAAPVDLPLDAAARRYQEALADAYGDTVLTAARPLFDVVLLGLGEDGHTASLFPGTSALEDTTDWVTTVTEAPKQPRLTLTYQAIASSRHVVFLVAGSGKAPMLSRLLVGDRTIPAGRVTSMGERLVFCDKAAMA